MKAYLLVDFGSTYTKLTCVDVDSEEILHTSKSITTVFSDVNIGYDKALKEMNKELSKKYENLKFEKILACSSAAGGLKMVAIGLSKNLTSEAAKRAALGAGARILKTYSYELKDSDIEEINNLGCDIVLLSGGTDGGNKRTILYNANMLRGIKNSIPIVVAGNKYAISEICEILKGKDITITENCMPQVNVLNADPVRNAIQKIFLDKIVDAKGMNELEGKIDGILMPTPAAVIKGAELLAVGTEDESGIGDLIVVDVGGATTDVHSIGYAMPKDNEVRFEGLREPFAKRTVEGDLGMRYSSLSLYEAVGEKALRELVGEVDILKEIKRRTEDIMMVPKTDDEFKFDESMASLAVKTSVKRHAGVLRKEFSYTRYIYYQQGKDLTDINTVIGTGGVIVHSKNPKNILNSLEYDKNAPLHLLPKSPNYYVDKSYILSAMGLLGTILPTKALKIMKKYLMEVK